MNDQYFFYKKCASYYKKALEVSIIIILIVVICIFYSFQSFPDEHIITIQADPPVKNMRDVPIERTIQNPDQPKAKRVKIPKKLGKLNVVQEFLNQKVEEPEIKNDIKPVFATVLRPPEPAIDGVPYHLCDEKPELIKSVKPHYPEVLRKAGIEGYVVVKALIDTNGDIERYSFLKPNEFFHDAVNKVIKQFKFKPGRQRDRLVKVWMSIPFQFRLK